jgi:hypothetical protein
MRDVRATLDKRDCPDRWQRQGQANGLTSGNTLTLEFINHSVDRSVKTACPTSEQTFLHALWYTLESVQDKIINQGSPEFQLLEVINPIIFEAWIRSGRS